MTFQLIELYYEDTDKHETYSILVEQMLSDEQMSSLSDFIKICVSSHAYSIDEIKEVVSKHLKDAGHNVIEYKYDLFYLMD